MNKTIASFFQLEASAEIVDRSPVWVSDSWQVLLEAGVLGWSIPASYGGTELRPVEILIGMEAIAARCLTTAFVLSQREAAVRQLLKGPPALKDRYLRSMVAGDQFLTVGLSQLTTSRQHTGPSLVATGLSNGSFKLDGEIPWVTGADQAAAIVAGATLPDASQLLIVVPTDRTGVIIDSPLPLAALVGSRTSLVRCENVIVDRDCVLAGPAETVLGKVGGGGLETSCLAIGLASAAIHLIEQEAESRPDLRATAESFNVSISGIRERLHKFTESTPDPIQTLSLRIDSTKLAIRSTQAGLMIAKGAGFIVPHSAQRWVRQAMFFLVWSCPRPVAEGILEDLTGS